MNVGQGKRRVSFDLLLMCDDIAASSDDHIVDIQPESSSTLWIECTSALNPLPQSWRQGERTVSVFLLNGSLSRHA
jgi:hypothetical protein